MTTAVAFLLFGLRPVSLIELLPGYVTAYLLIGACIFGPIRKVPSLRQAVAFLLPGTLLAPLALLNMGFWAGSWLLGLPAWGLLLSRWTGEKPLRPIQLLKFLGLLVLGLVVFTFNAIYPVASVGLFLLPVIPLVRLASPERRLQAGVELLLGVATVWIAIAIPTPEGAWSSPCVHAGGAATVGLMIAVWARGLPRRSRRLQYKAGRSSKTRKAHIGMTA
ncbi:hypothetical protein [Arthrobacter sp. B2I5]|uniref:hypothetical protein n=1 Tax=Arthrobacter sp. B2I5 TaxID=3042266 RepID=UPI0027D7AA43|nr:hypothetical protein [Arthrobacter sp. B2I5]